jgi:acyl carrier protein
MPAMSEQSTLDHLADVIRATLGQPQAQITLATTADDIDGWDSLRHSVLLMRIEQAFNIRFVPAEVIDLDNVGDLVKVIDAKLQG